ncbi:hypothetical protein HDU96_008911 [Phlyctochytrium bullatum]|nr:hypothetical protein HDU96_008911 [Phlyctochytrium bullatum]
MDPSHPPPTTTRSPPPPTPTTTTTTTPLPPQQQLPRLDTSRAILKPHHRMPGASPSPTTKKTPQDHHTAAAQLHGWQLPPPQPHAKSQQHGRGDDAVWGEPPPTTTQKQAKRRDSRAAAVAAAAAAGSGGVVPVGGGAGTKRRRGKLGGAEPETLFAGDDTEMLCSLYSATNQNQSYTIRVNAKSDSGMFFESPHTHWLCYRRNYFAISCSYELLDAFTSQPIPLQPGGTVPPALAVTVDPETNSTVVYNVTGYRLLLSGVMSESGREVRLLQHTPKRDKGPKEPPRSYTCLPGGDLSAPRYGGSIRTDDAGAGADTATATAQGGVFTQVPAASSAEDPFQAVHDPTRNVVVWERLQFKVSTTPAVPNKKEGSFNLLKIDVLGEVKVVGNDGVETVRLMPTPVATLRSAPIAVRGKPASFYEKGGAAVAEEDDGAVSPVTPVPKAVPRQRRRSTIRPEPVPVDGDALMQRAEPFAVPSLAGAQGAGLPSISTVLPTMSLTTDVETSPVFGATPLTTPLGSYFPHPPAPAPHIPLALSSPVFPTTYPNPHSAEGVALAAHGFTAMSGPANPPPPYSLHETELVFGDNPQRAVAVATQQPPHHQTYAPPPPPPPPQHPTVVPSTPSYAFVPSVTHAQQVSTLIAANHIYYHPGNLHSPSFSTDLHHATQLIAPSQPTNNPNDSLGFPYADRVMFQHAQPDPYPRAAIPVAASPAFLFAAAGAGAMQPSAYHTPGTTQPDEHQDPRAKHPPPPTQQHQHHPHYHPRQGPHPHHQGYGPGGAGQVFGGGAGAGGGGAGGVASFANSGGGTGGNGNTGGPGATGAGGTGPGAGAAGGGGLPSLTFCPTPPMVSHAPMQLAARAPVSEAAAVGMLLQPPPPGYDAPSFLGLGGGFGGDGSGGGTAVATGFEYPLTPSSPTAAMIMAKQQATAWPPFQVLMPMSAVSEEAEMGAGVEVGLVGEAGSVPPGLRSVSVASSPVRRVSSVAGESGGERRMSGQSLAMSEWSLVEEEEGEGRRMPSADVLACIEFDGL